MKKLELLEGVNGDELVDLPLSWKVKDGKLHVKGTFKSFQLDERAHDSTTIYAMGAMRFPRGRVGRRGALSIVADSPLGRKLIKRGLVRTYAKKKRKATSEDLRQALERNRYHAMERARREAREEVGLSDEHEEAHQ